MQENLATLQKGTEVFAEFIITICFQIVGIFFPQPEVRMLGTCTHSAEVVK